MSRCIALLLTRFKGIETDLCDCENCGLYGLLTRFKGIETAATFFCFQLLPRYWPDLRGLKPETIPMNRVFGNRLLTRFKGIETLLFGKRLQTRGELLTRFKGIETEDIPRIHDPLERYWPDLRGLKQFIKTGLEYMYLLLTRFKGIETISICKKPIAMSGLLTRFKGIETWWRLERAICA